MAAIQGIDCHWCHRPLWRPGEPLVGYPRCRCVGYGRHRFKAKIAVQRAKGRLRCLRACLRG